MIVNTVQKFICNSITECVLCDGCEHAKPHFEKLVDTGGKCSTPGKCTDTHNENQKQVKCVHI